MDFKSIKLDVGCGNNKQPGFIGMDKRKLKGVDIVHDLESFPYPIPDNSCRIITASHLVEHIKPWLMIDFMNELWRIMEPGGQLAFAYPYGVNSGFQQDPTHCLIDGAEVLTDSGFKKIQDVKFEEKILTLNIETYKTEYLKCTNVIYEDYDGDILTYKHKRIDIAVTPNHDMVWKTRQSNSVLKKSSAESFEKLKDASRIGYGSIHDWKGNDLVEKDDFMELLGWIISEGSFVQKGDHKRIRISQSKTANLDNRERIKILTKSMGIFNRESKHYIEIKSDEIFDELSILGKSSSRFIPLKYKNACTRQLFRLLESLIFGDGSKLSGGNGYSYTTISEKLSLDVSEIAVKLGLRPIIRKRKERIFTNSKDKTYIRKPQFRITICPDRMIIYPTPNRIKYKGKIVCVTVEKNHTFLSRYNGQIIWVGNCNPCNQATWTYFDPGYQMYDIYFPNPWFIENNLWQETGQGEVLFKKLTVSEGKERLKLRKKAVKLSDKNRKEFDARVLKAKSKTKRVDKYIKEVVEKALVSDDIEERKNGIIQNRGKALHRLIYGVPMTGIVRGEWALARFNQIVPCNWSKVDLTQWLDQWSPLGFTVADARNIIATTAVEQEFEWLFFHDHDVILPQGVLIWLNELMIKRDIPVISGIYFTKSVPSEPLIYREKGGAYFDKWKFGDRVWAGFVHMGCTLIHVSLLKAMYDESPEYVLAGRKVRKIFETPAKVWYDPSSDAFHALSGTEDIHWCDKVVVNRIFEKAGWPQYQAMRYPFLVDTNIYCKHISFDGMQYPGFGEDLPFEPERLKMNMLEVKNDSKTSM